MERALPAEIVDEQLYTMSETARLCRISVKTLAFHRDKGDIRYTLFGRRTYRFKGYDIRAFQQEQSRKACPSTRKRARRTGTTTSRSEVSDFLAARERRMKERREARKNSSENSAGQR
jgi:hypothetical protein